MNKNNKNIKNKIELSPSPTGDATYQYMAKDRVFVMNKDPKHNVKYPVEVINEDGTIESVNSGNYWLKIIGKTIRLFGKMGKRNWELERIPLDKAQIKYQERKAKTTLEKAVLDWLYERCRDLHNLEDLFSDGVVDMLRHKYSDEFVSNDIEDAMEEDSVQRRGRGGAHIPQRDRDEDHIDTEENIKVHRGKHIIIKGLIQSGKSSFMLCSALRYMFSSLRMSTIIVLRDARGDYNQLKGRLEEMQEQLNEHLRRKKIEGEIDLVVLGDHVNRTDFEAAMTGDNPKIFLLLGNEAQINRINKLIEQAKEARFALFIDEADSNDTGECARSLALTKMKEFATNVFYVSATILEIGLREKIERGGVYMLETPAHYMGLEKSVLRILPHEDAKPSNKIADIPTEKDPNLAEFIEYFERLQPHFADFVQRYHPRHCLMSIGNVIEPQRKLFKLIAEKDIAVLLYNGDGVDLYHHSLTKDVISVEYLKNQYINSSECKWHTGAHTFSNKVGIASVIQWLKDNGDVKRFPRIITISGKLAGRGISFTSKDYGKYLDGFQNCKRPNFIGWRLTSMYYIPAKNTNQPNIMQCAGRLCCVVRDNIQNVLYTTQTVFDDIRNAYWAQEELIGRARQIQEEETNEILCDAIRSIKMTREKLSKRALTINEDRHLPRENLVKDDSNEPGAFDMEKTYRKVIEDKNEEETEKFDLTFMKNLIELEEKRRVTEEEAPENFKDQRIKDLEKNVRTAIRTGRDTIVLRIIKFLKREIEASKSDIRKNCKAMDFGHYDKWAKEHGRYKIVISTDNNLYTLNPEIDHIVALVE